MAFRFADDYRARVLALKTRFQRAGGTSEGVAGRRRGGRVDFHDHRPYAPGDEPRDIDWNTLLRLDTLVTKEYARDEAPEVAVVLDRSASMGASGSGKDRVAREVAGGLAWIGLCARCPVSVLVAAEGGPVTLGTFRTHRRLERLLSLLEGLGDPVGGTHLTALRHLRPATAAGRVTYLLSDFLEDPLPAEAAVALARGAGTGWLLHVVAEDERHPALPASCTLGDPESAARLQVADAGRLLGLYAEELAAHEDAVATLARRHGLGSALVSDAAPFDRTVLRIVASGEPR